MQDLELLEGDQHEDRHYTGTSYTSASSRLSSTTGVFGISLYALIVLILLGLSTHYASNISTSVYDLAKNQNVATGEASNSGKPTTSEIPEYDKAVDGMKKLENSFFEIYMDSGDGDRVLFGIPESFVAHNTEMLVTALFEYGDGIDILYHLPADDTNYDVFSFRATDNPNRLDMVRSQLDLRNIEDNTLDTAMDNGAWPGYVHTFEVLATKLENKQVSMYLVDVSDIILKKGMYVTDVSTSPEWSEQPRIHQIKPFPSNIEIVGFYPQEESIAAAVHFSIYKLPSRNNLMVGRVADDRVGYFATAFKDIGSDGSIRLQNAHASKSKSSDHVDKKVFLINRRRLVKADPTKEKSPTTAGSQIRYYIDPSVPQQWRQAIKEGVEAWNVAFEAAGFLNAVKAILPDDPDWPSDYSAGDIRYSTISWAIGTGSTFALGPSTVDPRSGEILNADIVFTHGWIHAYMRDFDTKQRESEAKPDTENRDVQDNLVHLNPSQFHHRHCQHMRKDDMGLNMLSKLHALSRDEDLNTIIQAGLKDVTMHEVGHTLGLRHNFKGSTAIPFSHLKDKTKTSEHGLTSSVMDYLPVAILFNTTGNHYFTPHVGSYDVWAIRYGYTEFENEKTGILHPNVASILSEINTDDKIFATDEDVPRSNGEDPYTNLFDLGKEPLDFYEDRMELVRDLHKGLYETVEVGESWTKLSAAHSSLVRTIEVVALYTLKFVGGNLFSKVHKGDIQDTVSPITPINRETTSRALNLISTIMTDDSLFFDYDQLSHFVRRVGWCSSLEPDCFGLASTNVLTEMEYVRTNIFNTLLHSDRLKRIQFQSSYSESSFNLDLLLNTISVMLFGEDSDMFLLRLGQKSIWPLQVKFIDQLSEYLCGNNIELSTSALKAFADVSKRLYSDGNNTVQDLPIWQRLSVYVPDCERANCLKEVCRPHYLSLK